MENRFREIQRRIASLNSDVTLVAVSKFQPIEAIVALYQCGQRVFGENYVNELVTKASDLTIKENCPQIEWKFIGNLQTNKVNQLLRVERLTGVSSVDSLKLAKALNKRELNVWIQINSSEEQNKGGVKPSELLSLCNQIKDNCDKLKILGLMTIGRQDNDVIPNPDFQTMISCGQEFEEEFGFKPKLSFGMSHDFEHAIEMGSNEVRVGTAIFGQRNK